MLYRRLIEEETEHSDVPGPIGIILFFLFLKNGFHTAMRIFNLAAARLCFAAHVDVEISFAILILYIYNIYIYSYKLFYLFILLTHSIPHK